MHIAFDQVLTAEAIGSYKPSARNFQVLLQRVVDAGHTSTQLLHVAQSLFHDHVPAKAMGLDTVWINRRHNKPGWGATPNPNTEVRPDLEFTSLAAFADAVDTAFTMT